MGNAVPLSWRKIALVSAAVAVVVSVAVAALIYGGIIAGSYDICEPDPQTGQERCATYLLGSFIVKSAWMALDNSGDALIALATLAIATFTFTLWRATVALHRASRPWIDLTMKANSVLIYDDRVTVEFTVTLRNIGSTPALNVVVEITSDTAMAPSRGLLTNETIQKLDTRPRGAYLPQRPYYVTRSMAFQWGEGTEIDPAAFGWQPSITVSARYDLPTGGRGHTQRSFLIGREVSKPGDVERFRLCDKGTEMSLFARALQGDKAE